MKNKLVSLLGIIVIFTNFSVQADSINYGLFIDGGPSVGGYKVKWPGGEIGAEISHNAAANLFFGMDFGQKGEEVAGFYLSGGYGARKIVIEKEKGNEGNGNSRGQDERTKEEENGFRYVGVTFGVGAKIMFAYFNGGCIYTKLGCDGMYYIYKSSIGRNNISGKGGREGQEELDEKTNNMNLAAKLEFGVELLDQVLFLGIGARYFFLEQFNLSDDEQEQMKNAQVEMNLGKGQVDLNIFLGVNFGKLGSGDSNARSEKSSKRGGKNSSKKESSKKNSSRGRRR